MSWQIIALLVGVTLLLLMLMFIAKSKTGMMEVSSQIIDKLRI